MYSLTYIYHDCFILETENAVVIFDYWKDPLSGRDKDWPPLLDLLPKGKDIYVVISHHHKDHFSRRVFLWQQRFSGIRYIISEDVAKSVRYMLKEEGSTYKGYRPEKDSVTVLAPGETYEDGRIRIKAYRSTDIGNSYALDTDGKSFFHAGDLNAWTWIDESTQEEIQTSRLQFTEIVEEIRKEFRKFDVVMFPVDSRQGTDYWWGARYFIEQISAELFIPMHFELVMDEKDKTQRRIDAAAFAAYYHSNCRQYLQLGSTRSRYIDMY